MSNSGVQSPLGVNVLGALLNNQGLTINPVAKQILGESQSLSTYTFGTIVTGTCLNYLVQAIDEAYTIGIDTATYDNLISIGAGSIPALGDSKPTTYTNTASNTGPLGNLPAWGGANYAAGEECTRFGFMRLIALQAYDEFNYNNSLPAYKDFLNSIQVCQGFILSQNTSIQTLTNSKTFLSGVYSNINDLITGDISGVNLATLAFGKDLQNLGKALDLSRISSFGLPSNLLITLQKNNAVTKSVSLALLSTGFSVSEIQQIATGVIGATRTQEKQIYQAFSIILGQDLFDVLVPLNCKTTNLQSLVDLLNPLKLFPNSYQSLTVPVYNLTEGPTNSKTYYLIYNNDGVNSSLNQPSIANQIGTITPPGPPPVKREIASDNVENAYAQLSEVKQQEILKQYNEYINGPKYNDLINEIKLNDDYTLSGGSSKITFTEYLNTIWIKTTNIQPTNNNQLDQLSSITYQQPSVGFGSYLDKILPNDIALSAGAFSYSMQQVKNITNIPIEKFAQVVSTLETTKSLNINGTNIPVDVTGVNQALSLVSKGSGPNNSYTTSDFFGCMSSLPYDWTKIKTLINELETNRAGSAGNRGLYQIYQALYDAVVANNPSTPPGEAIIQTLIDEANTEIQNILNANSIKAAELNAIYNIIGAQLNKEQIARSLALFPVPNPRDDSLSRFPESQMSFVDAIPAMSVDTRPHMFAQTLEAISNLSTLGGQSIIGMLRETRNQTRLSLVGIPVDNNISQYISEKDNKTLVANGVLPGTIPATLKQLDSNGNLVEPQRYGVYDPITNTYDSIYRKNTTLVPGSLADPENLDIIPELDPVYFSDITLPSTPSVSEAIDEVIRCNCDCWDNL